MSLTSASPTTRPASRVLSKMIVDAQEHIIYCANSVLANKVLRFTASSDDLVRRFHEDSWRVSTDGKIVAKE